MIKSWRIALSNRIISFMPATRMYAVKRALLRWSGVQVGSNVRVASSARFLVAGHLFIGDGTWIGHDVLIVGGETEIHIGSNVDIAPRVLIVAGSHELFVEVGRAAGPGYSSPIVIGDGVWIGASATILGGSSIGKGSMVAAGALLSGTVADDTVVSGVPARPLFTREEYLRLKSRVDA